MAGPGPSKPQAIADSEDEDGEFLAKSEVLTQEEVLKRRARGLIQLTKCYRDVYWSLMEEVRRKHREYCWKFGSPFEEEGEREERENGVMLVNVSHDQSNADHHHHDHHHRHHQSGNGNIEINGGKLGLGFRRSFKNCGVDACKGKAMPLTDFCHTHILYDSKQTLYIRCKFRRSTESGAIQCSKPILRSSIPSLCPAHVLTTEKTIKQALKKHGVSFSSSAKLASKFHCVISEYVGIIQSTRRDRAKARCNIKREHCRS